MKFEAKSKENNKIALKFEGSAEDAATITCVIINYMNNYIGGIDEQEGLYYRSMILSAVMKEQFWNIQLNAKDISNLPKVPSDKSGKKGVAIKFKPKNEEE